MRFLFFILFTVTAFAQDKLTLHFLPDGTVPDTESIEAFNRWNAENPRAEVTQIIAFADTTQTIAYNDALTDRRLTAIADLLQSAGIPVIADAKRISAGERKSNTALRSDRRVEIFYVNLPTITPTPELPAEVTPDPEPLIAEDEFRQDRLSDRVVTEFQNAAKGDVIRIHNINFYLNSDQVMKSSEPVMEALYQTLARNPKLKVEIHGHMCCNAITTDTGLSASRAKRIFRFLTKRGISSRRLGYRGFGSAHPIYRIPEQNFEQERINRRVEILIVDNPGS